MCALELFSKSAFCFDVNEYVLWNLSASLFLCGYMYLDGICNDLIYVTGFPLNLSAGLEGSKWSVCCSSVCMKACQSALA